MPRTVPRPSAPHPPQTSRVGLPVRVRTLAFQIACLFALASFSESAVASGLWVSDEIVVDPGVRSVDPSGFRTRLDFCRVGDQVTATWATGSRHGSGDAQVVVLNERGESDGVSRTVYAEPGVLVLQALPFPTGEWSVVRTGPNGLEFVRKASLHEPTVETLVLDPGRIETSTVHTEWIDGSVVIAWGSEDGSVRRVRVLPDFTIAGEVENLGPYTGSLDLEFGEDGGVLAWSAPNGIAYILLGPDGHDVGPLRSIPGVPIVRAFSAARIGEYAMFLLVPRNDRDPSEVLVVAARNGSPLELVEIDLDFESESQMASGPTSVIVVGRDGTSTILDAWGHVIAEPRAPAFSGPIGYDLDGPLFDVVWNGSAYVVAGSELAIEVGPAPRAPGAPDALGAASVSALAPASASASVSASASAESQLPCYVFNRITGRTLSPSGDAGPAHYLNGVFLPGVYQPWFAGTNLRLMIEDAKTNELIQVAVPSNDPPSVLRRLGRYTGCDRSVRMEMGVASSGQLTTLRWTRETDDVYGEDHTWTLVHTFREDGTYSSEATPEIGNEWDLAVVDGDTWIVSDYRDRDGVRSTRAWSVDTSETWELEPTPSGNSQILDLDGTPYVVWRQDTDIYGALVPSGGGGTIYGRLLYTGTDVTLYTATEGFLDEGGGVGTGGDSSGGGAGTGDPEEPGRPRGIVIFADRQDNGDPGLFSLPIGSAPDRVYESSLISSSRPNGVHALWADRHFFVAWGPTSRSTFRIARINGWGLDENPSLSVEIESDAPYAPILAAGTEGNLAVAYGGNRVRFLRDDLTPILASGPFAESTEAGIELTWQLSEGEIVRVEVERSDADGPDGFQPIGTLSGRPVPATFVDGAVETMRGYLYRVRLLSSDGESELLGPVAATYWWQPTVAATLSLWPNPTHGRLELSLNGATAWERIEVVDVLGRLRAVVTDEAAIHGRPTRGSAGSALTSTWDLSDQTASLPSGSYWVRVVGPGLDESRRIQIVR